MKKIRIHTPPSAGAIARVRSALVGLEIIVNEDEAKEILAKPGRWRGKKVDDGYYVLTSDVVRALRSAGHMEAAHYCKEEKGEVICFEKTICDLIEE